MRDKLTRHRDLLALRLSAYASHEDHAFLAVLSTLIVLWAIGGKLLIGVGG